TLADIAWEKAGIVKETSHLVLGETDAALAPIFGEAGAATTWERGTDFACADNRPAHGGRVMDLRTPKSSFEEVFLPVHGAHQGENAAVAAAAAEAFFGAPLCADVVAEAFHAVRLPGRMEVVSRSPLVILDGAHNPAGGRAAAATLAGEFAAARSRVLVLGLLRGRDPEEMLQALGGAHARAVVACPPPSPRALPADEVADAARTMGLHAVTADSVDEAVERGLAMAGSDDLVLVTGSLYLVGAARSVLVPASP
nr:bifunctional folylpolyglutamate synthase/dihydrofolate synthase [Actinomycetota bacterium]